MALTTNLVSYWKFDEASGNAADSVTTNTLTNTGTATYASATARINNGVVLNGSSQYMTISNASQTGLGITGNMSMSFWINWSAYVGSTIYVLAGKHTLTTNPQRGYSIQKNITATNSLDCEIYDGTTVVRKGVPWTPTTATLYHIVVVYSTAGTVDFYINNVAQTQQTGYGTVINNNSEPFTVGSALDSTQTYFVPGTMDELGIWNRTLSSLEVSQLWNGGAGLPYPLTVAATPASSQFLLLGVG